MRFATDAFQNNESMFGNPGAYINDTEVLPSTRGVVYPQDQRPAGLFGDGVDPTTLPMMRDNYMRSPFGGISQLAPSMTDGYVDHPAVQDTGLPYVVSPEIQRLRRQSMDTFQGLDPVDLRQFFKGV